MGTFRWSPDGSRLAYRYGNSLWIADTLGASRETAALELGVFRCEWLSDKEIVVGGWRPGVASNLVKINLDNGSVTEFLRWETVDRDPQAIRTEYDGPFRSLEGNVYYRKSLLPIGSLSPVRSIDFPKSDYGKNEVVPSQNHFLEWGTDCLYRISCDLKDTVRLSGKPISWPMFTPVMKTDGSMYIVRGVIYKTADSSTILLDNVIGDKPPGTVGCSIMDGSFDPVSPAVVFCVGCDDGHGYDVTRVCVFDYGTGEFTNLDELTGINNCTAPCYSPDGARIAAVSHQRLYLITLERR